MAYELLSWRYSVCSSVIGRFDLKDKNILIEMISETWQIGPLGDKTLFISAFRFDPFQAQILKLVSNIKICFYQNLHSIKYQLAFRHFHIFLCIWLECRSSGQSIFIADSFMPVELIWKLFSFISMETSQPGYLRSSLTHAIPMSVLTKRQNFYI